VKISSLTHYKRDHLPNDVDSLKDIIDELVPALQLLERKHEDLKAQIELLKHEKFGKKSEKSGSHSYSARLSERFKESSKKHPGRQALPAHLERVRVEHDLTSEEKICPLCLELMVKIQDVKTEQLDIIPNLLQVKQHVRFLYACRKCYGGIKRAPLGSQPIDKGLPTSRLLAHVMASKFADHMPFYRQERWFARLGCPITRATMWGWENKITFELDSLVNCLKTEVKTRGHLFGDDTPMPTLEAGLGRTKIGRFWTYTSPRDKKKPEVIVYEYTPDRKGEHPQAFLKDSKGFFQSDAYSGFNKLLENKIKVPPKGSKNGPLTQDKLTLKSVGCWSHVRRKFVDVLKIDPLSVALEVVDLISELYKVERLAKEKKCSDAQRKKLRTKESKPILKKIHEWLVHNKSRASPTGGVGKAIQYALNNWSPLNTFLQDGRLEIDNNRSERAIKPIVIGRKNYMFMGGPRGGAAAATLYSLIETCKANKVDPYHYLADVLERLPTHPNKRIQELLPQNWAPSQSFTKKTQHHMATHRTPALSLMG